MALLLLTACFPYFDKIEDNKKIVESRFPNGSQFIEENGHRLHYVRTGDTGPLIVFVHGSPGSWDAFAEYLVDPLLLSRARMISVDRPGFGLSDAGIPEHSLKVQAALIARAISKEKKDGRVILIGHSFGGPVIARIAMDFPELCDGLIFVAASVDPSLEKTAWYQIPASWKIIRWMIPKSLDVTNQEILTLKDELTDMDSSWSKIKQPAIVLQGTEDNLVPQENADFIKKKLKQAEISRIPGMNHFIPWARPDLIRDAISHLL